MALVRVKDNIDWVGYVDWNIRDFHGYVTGRGSSYNAYLVRDEKVALIDTVKAPFVGALLGNVAERVGLDKVDYVVCNHAEPDHASGLSAVLRACPQAVVVCNARCRETLGRYQDTSGWKFMVIADGQTLSLGRTTLRFIDTPMVHWPESMFTYVPEHKLLFSMDAFGQHYASSERFDDQNPMDEVMAEAKTYYANILMPYGSTIARALEKCAGLAIETLATAHGVIWRKDPGRILAAYKDWITLKSAPKVLVIYDTMWKSTQVMAEAIAAGASVEGVSVKPIWIRASNETVIATEVLDAACVAFGSPTLNSTLMPSVAQIMAYLKGLRPAGKAGFVFGSYGWARGAAADMEQYFTAMRMVKLREPLFAQYYPTPEILAECAQAGKLLAETALGKRA